MAFRSHFFYPFWKNFHRKRSRKSHLTIGSSIWSGALSSSPFYDLLFLRVITIYDYDSHCFTTRTQIVTSTFWDGHIGAESTCRYRKVNRLVESRSQQETIYRILMDNGQKEENKKLVIMIIPDNPR